MSFHANGENLKLGRGALFLAPWSGSTPPSADTLGEFIGNITSLELSSENETREKYSSTEQSSPLLDSRVIRQAYEMVASLDEHTLTNLKLFMSGDATTVNQSATTSGSKTLNDVELGQTYYIGARNVTNVAVKKGTTTKTAGTDYLLDATLGLLTILSTGTLVSGDDLTVTYHCPAATIQKVRGGTTVSPTYKLTFQADDANADGDAAKDRLTVWKVSVNPDGAYGLISDDYAQFGLRFKLLSDSTNHPTEPFFILERV
jgi:hypothetical protein